MNSSVQSFCDVDVVDLVVVVVSVGFRKTARARTEMCQYVAKD